MSVAVVSVKERFDEIEQDTPITVSFPLHDAAELTVYYGAAGIEAVLNVDYTIELNEETYADFVLTPLESLLLKIEDDEETNTILVYRELPYTTPVTPASARDSNFLSREFDRTILRFQQIDERLSRSLIIGLNIEDAYDLTLPVWVADKLLGWHPTLKKIVNVDRPADGEAATITIGTVTTVAPGDPATVTNSGTPNEAVFDFELPQGVEGDTGTIAIGTVDTVPYGDPATVTDVGVPGAAILNFEIPEGPQGIQGPAATITVGMVTTVAAGQPATVVNVGTSGAAIFDFEIPQGNPGVLDSIVGGTGIDVDASNPTQPIVSVNVTEIFTASVTEINYTSGVTGPIQAQIDNAMSATQGKHTIWIPAGAMAAATTNGAASGTGETTTNKIMRKTLDFDASTEEFAQFFIQMPKSWDEGTLILQAIWSHAATTVNFGVAWGFEAVAFGDDDAYDAAWGTEIVVTDVGGTTDDVYITAESAALTVAGSPGAQELVAFRVTRVVGNAGDTMAIDARLHGVKIHYTTNANTDN